MIGITILGSTGSIGVNTLDVISRNRNKFRVVALTAHNNHQLLAEQCIKWQPAYAVLTDASAAEALEQKLKNNGCKTTLLSGKSALEKVSSLDEVDYVMAAIVGAAGLLPTLAAARSGKRILLANKESLVMSGRILIETIRANNAELLPIDSEHNAIFQCMPTKPDMSIANLGIKRILLTASGGPFRNTPLEELEDKTPDQACAHPNWDMGRKISVDSATMMNKGLEVIEACWLFDCKPENIQVVLHPQSVIHSMVEYIDGSVLAQLGNPDMRSPIAHALAWPERMTSGVTSLDLFEVAQLQFEKPDLNRFPCLRLASEAMASGGTSTAILNAANEVAVDAFLRQQIRFTHIPTVVEKTLNDVPAHPADTLEIILEDDQQARTYAVDMIRNLAA